MMTMSSADATGTRTPSKDSSPVCEVRQPSILIRREVNPGVRVLARATFLRELMDSYLEERQAWKRMTGMANAIPMA